MASVSGIPLDVCGNGAANGAVALSLAAAPRKSHLRYFPADQWEIEMRAGLDHVVARTEKILSHNAMLDEAIETIHRGLDLTSVEELDHLVTVAPANNYITLLRQGGNTTLRYYALIDFPVETSVAMQIQRADGTIESPSTPPPLTWSTAFRFHRLSQSNGDLFDAFRNLYLSLEALLDQLWQKQSGEKEKRWFDRALLAASAKVNFSQFATPGTLDPVRDVSNQIYDVRVHLFHAKTGRTLIPDQSVGYLKVADAYRILLSLWTGIVRAWLGLARGGGVITYGGFKMLVEGPFASARLAVTADDTIAGNADVASPKDMVVTQFSSRPRIVEIRPGHMALIGETAVSALPTPQSVGRILVMLEDGTLMFLFSIGGGLSLEGTDVLEVTNVARLVNRSQPRTEFA
jgi:hypothetical protein